MNKQIDLSDVYMLKTEEEAQKIVEQMRYIANEYGMITQADFKDLIDREAYPEESKRGWLAHMIEKVKIVPTELGYFIEFPRSTPLE